MGGKSNSETLNPEIRKIRLNELKAFVESNEFSQFAYVPVSPSRAKSYLENPYGKPEDVALILALVNKNLVAFRSLFAGEIQTENEKIRFAWCSGNWVHPAFRRKGLSKILLEEAYAGWNGKLMGTNYAPESEKLYLKTGWFKPIHQFDGVRAYLFPKTVKLIASARKGKIYSILFSWADSFIAAVSSLRIQLFRYSKKIDVQFEIIGKPDNETLSFAEKFKNRFVFGQGEKELTWIFDYPWISDENQEVEKKYPFSSVCESFKYQTVKIYQQNKLKAVFIFSLREGHLKTLFFWNTEGLENEIVQFLKLYSVKRKVEMLTVYHAEIAKLLFNSRFPFLWIKKYGQKIYSSFPVAGLENKKFQDGEGDFGFS